MGEYARHRAYARLKFNSGLKGELRLMNHEGERLSEAYANIVVLNMNPDSLTFMSGLRLPVNREYLVDFRFNVGGVLLNVRGHVAWRSKIENHYEYGVDFYPPHKLRPLLVRILNQELLRQNPRDYKLHCLYRKLSDKAFKV